MGVTIFVMGNVANFLSFGTCILLLSVCATTRPCAYADDARRGCRIRRTVAAGVAGDHPVRVQRVFRTLRVAGGGDVPRAAGHRARPRLHVASRRALQQTTVQDLCFNNEISLLATLKITSFFVSIPAIERHNTSESCITRKYNL